MYVLNSSIIINNPNIVGKCYFCQEILIDPVCMTCGVDSVGGWIHFYQEGGNIGYKNSIAQYHASSNKLYIRGANVDKPIIINFDGHSATQIKEKIKLYTVLL